MDFGILILSLSIIGLIFTTLKERYTKKKQVNKYLLYAIMIVLIIVAIFSFFQSQQEFKNSHFTGQISGTLNNKVLYPVVAIGGAKIVSNGTSLNLSMFGLDQPFGVWLENGQLKLSVTVLDDNNHIITTIDGNQWQSNPSLNYDINYDISGIEVVDEKGNVVLQADFDGKEVNLAGIFHRSDGRRIAIGPALNGEGIIEIRPNGVPFGSEVQFKQLFCHPSSLCFGERVR